MENIIRFLLLVLVLGVVSSPSAWSATSGFSAPEGAKRTRIKLQKDALGKFGRPSALMQAISLEPVLNSNDEVACMRISEIRDAAVGQIYKARVGDCLSEVRIFHNDRTGISSDVYPVYSETDAMVLYKDLIGAQRVDVDLKRNDKIVLMTYVVD